MLKVLKFFYTFLLQASLQIGENEHLTTPCPDFWLRKIKFL